ncbi:unnamed protein product [Penicillium salamii]|uniref:Uncharacterized protein n=1 Tax=Penicillium salamii TaxID=1612424 RepID=A0A9W4IUG9_9EURO|nr:unnamed protein product [Penicillium salamii]
MPDVHIVNDDASFASSDTFSTRDSTEPTRPLARRNTVSQLTRKVSKRISQSILGGGQHHDLSERNLKALEGATVSDRQFHDTKIYDPIHEDIEDECPSVNPEAQREARLHESYATFCQSFTMSGSTRTSRQFDLSMGTETANESEFSQTKQSLAYNTIEPLHSPTSKWPGYITVYSEPGPTADAFPISPSGNINTPTSPSTDCKKNSHDCSRPDTPIYEDNLSRQHANNLGTSRHPNYPPPPPQIITPDVYMDMQREERERKAARRQKLLYPFRSWFLSTPPFWTRRYEVAE